MGGFLRFLLIKSGFDALKECMYLTSALLNNKTKQN